MDPAPKSPSKKGTRTRSAKAEYQSRRRLLLHYLYFKTEEERHRLEEMATIDGYGHDFNGWLLVKLHAALSGSVFPADYVDGLKRDLERTRTWLESVQDQAEAYRKENATLRDQAEALLRLLLDTAEGSEKAKKFLAQKAQGASA